MGRSSSNSSPSEFDGVSSFVVRRAISLSYCVAFLSLLAQVDGLYGCDGLHPPKAKGLLPVAFVPFALSSAAFLGALLASAALLAGKICENHSVATFVALWLLFAFCLELTPSVFTQLEDKLLVEMGLVAIFLAARGSSSIAIASRNVGRSLAAWLLFRAVFSGGAQKLIGSCGAWRNLSALTEIYQLEPFPLPSAWIMHIAPLQVGRALTILQLYIEIVMSPFMLLPWRVIAWPAALSQLVSVGLSCFLANKGLMPLCYFSLALSFFDNAWHKAIWSENMLNMWGCSEVEAKEDEQNEEEEEDEEEEEEGDDANQNNGECGSRYVDDIKSNSYSITLLCYFFGYVASVVGALNFAQSDAYQGPSQTLRTCVCCIASLAVVMAVLASRWNCGLGGDMGRLPLGMLGILVWLCGALQFAGDTFAEGNFPVHLRGVSATLERLHIAHMLGAGAREVQPCLQADGRIDFVVQGAVLGEDTRKSPFISLSSRYLPIVEERRPSWLQPYTPRLDKELWRLAQKPVTSKKAMDVPKWVLRLMTSLALRQGAAAQLSVGPWEGINAMLYGPGNSQYAKLTPPLPAMTISRMSHRPVKDVRSFKWWKKLDSKVVHMVADEDLYKSFKKFATKCYPLPWAELPVSELLTALLIAAFLGKMLVPNKKKKKRS